MARAAGGEQFVMVRGPEHLLRYLTELPIDQTIDFIFYLRPPGGPWAQVTRSRHGFELELGMERTGALEVVARSDVRAVSTVVWHWMSHRVLDPELVVAR